VVAPKREDNVGEVSDVGAVDVHVGGSGKVGGQPSAHLLEQMGRNPIFWRTSALVRRKSAV
jgi:hypothetical protein